MPELTPEPDSTGGENLKKKKIWPEELLIKASNMI
jgi:hypothetical protein